MRGVLGGFMLVAVVLLYRHFAGDFRFAPIPERLLTTPVITPRDAAPAVTRRTTSIPTSYLRNPLRFLSHAPADSLELLPGIGPVLAERLASARSGKSLFTRWEDLLGVKGIGPKKLQTLKDAADEANIPTVDQLNP